MTLPARTAPFAAPCQHCHAAEAILPTGCCLECAVEIAHDAHDQALLEHARRGGTYDTRPVFIHPARQLSGVELADGLTRLAAWHAFLATHPEARTLTRGTPHDAGGTAASQGGSPGQAHELYESDTTVSSSEAPVDALEERVRMLATMEAWHERVLSGTWTHTQYVRAVVDRVRHEQEDRR